MSAHIKSLEGIEKVEAQGPKSAIISFASRTQAEAVCSLFIVSPQGHFKTDSREWSRRHSSQLA